MIKKIGVSLVIILIVSACTGGKRVNSTYSTDTQPVIVQPAPITENVPLEEPVLYQVSTTVQENISVREAYNMMRNDDVSILDVRTQPETISDGKIHNSQLIPLQVLGSYLDRLDNSKPILVYCHTGNRSAVASEILRNQGFNAINVLGGINAWKANGLPVE